MSYISATDEIMYAPLFFRFVAMSQPTPCCVLRTSTHHRLSLDPPTSNNPDSSLNDLDRNHNAGPLRPTPPKTASPAHPPDSTSPGPAKSPSSAHPEH